MISRSERSGVEAPPITVKPEHQKPPPGLEVVRIKPVKSCLALDARETWSHRELLYFLVWRDVKVRYKQTALGVLWVILQPVLTTVVLTLLFSTFAGFQTGDVPYPLFALSGVLVWFFINSSINGASNSMVANQSLVTKVYFPRLIMPVSAVLANLLDFVLGFLILIGLMIYYGVTPTWNLALVPLFLALGITLALSFGMLAAALNVRFRDVKFALPFALQLWMFASPVFYPTGILSEKGKFLLTLNPLTGILEGLRTALFGGDFNWLAIAFSLAATVILFLFSLYVFRQMEDDFADLI